MEPVENPTEQQLARRKAARERKARQRSKERARSDRSILAYFDGLRAERAYAEDIARRSAKGMCTFGEVEPGINADTLGDALEVAREMARAIGAADVMDGESLLDFEKRIFGSWINFAGFVGHDNAGGSFPFAGGGGAPYLNRATGELFPGFGKSYWVDHGGFEKNWTPLPGAKEKIDLATLPKLKAIRVEESKPEPIPPPPKPTQPIPEPNVAHFAWVPPQARSFLN